MQFEQTGNKYLPYEVIVGPHEAEVVSEVYGIINLERSIKRHEDLATKGIWRAVSESARRKESASIPCDGLGYAMEIADVLEVFSELAPQREEAIKNMPNRRHKIPEYLKRNDKLGKMAGECALNLLTSVTGTLNAEITDRAKDSNVAEFPQPVEAPAQDLDVIEPDNADVAYLEDRRMAAVS